MIIRDERNQDHGGIAQVIRRSFDRTEEARLVDQLRQDNDAVVSLVAEKDGAVAGHIMLSRMAAPFRALGLAPLSVLPEHQRQGVGAALVQAAIRRAKERQWSAILVLGDQHYYSRFGFRSDLAAGFTSPYAGPHLMMLPLEDPLPARSGRIDYAKAFRNLA